MIIELLSHYMLPQFALYSIIQLNSGIFMIGVILYYVYIHYILNKIKPRRNHNVSA